MQNDGNAINETWHRCESSQGNHCEGGVGHFVTVSETLQDQSRLSVRVHVTTFSVRQLYPVGFEIFQPAHHDVHWIEKFVSFPKSKSENSFSCDKLDPPPPVQHSHQRFSSLHFGRTARVDGRQFCDWRNGRILLA